MWEHLYALGITCIELVQDSCHNQAIFFEQVNDFYNPKNVLDVLFPAVSFLDSVFASQLLLVASCGAWLNGILKWVFLEDRPYWWIHETDYYRDLHKPHIFQTSQTCETGPGNPSGHTASAASVLMLIIMWISHICNDRQWTSTFWKITTYPILAVQLLSVMLARMYVATHFPHQCLLGALIGAILAPALCIYVTDPYIWNYGRYAALPPGRARQLHMMGAFTAFSLAYGTYITLVYCGINPHFTVKLAYEYCHDSSNIHVTTTPLFAMVQCTAVLIGWTFFVTPDVAKFRHDTYQRSLIISAFATLVTTFAFKYAETFVSDRTPGPFLIYNFFLNILKPLFYLRVLPELSMWPFKDK